ncbi:MAG: hypothetical protein KTR21_01560 [Rhodobacteraceae bacterium]|nr:hypothetical protein [Paracoccaceae bacterium]
MGLDAEMRAAHEAGDSHILVDLYTRAAEARFADQDVDAACFYLTHARVWALDAGDPRAEALLMRLAAEGRDSI